MELAIAGAGRAASSAAGASWRGKRHDLHDGQCRPRPVEGSCWWAQTGAASSLRAAASSCGFCRSSTHRAPWGVALATPRTNRCVCCAAAPSSPSSSSSDPGTDQARFELRLEPQLDTPSPLGRGSSHAPNKAVRLPLASGRGLVLLVRIKWWLWLATSCGLSRSSTH